MKVLIKSKLFRVCGYTTPESMRDPNRENSMRKKVAFMVVLNLAIVSYCVGLYFQGHSMQRVLAFGDFAERGRSNILEVSAQM
jgi:hypothetical protein